MPFIQHLTVYGVLFFALTVCGFSDLTQSPSSKVAMNEHPALLYNKKDVAELKNLHKKKGLRAQLAQRIVDEATLMASLPLPEKVMEGMRLLSISRMAVKRVLFTSLAYLITEEPIHLETARKTMLAVARFDDWNPSHFLDVAEMTAAVAIGYDTG